ncbi:DUF4169 family protein [Sphingomonas soli]|uniref:DUF4169 family protein n=1 Tax=Sphingomonas soli TaxID=266127 RepID=UPI000A02503C|nr:DUF4169 family protein [Sphingomonas soli]
MGEVVNLRQARKARDRKVRAVQADANRALHGRTKAERLADAAERQRIAQTLDGAKRED